MNKHTPGPWEVKTNSIGNPTVESSSSMFIICHTPLATNETRCNARLIAAAPEMLEALEHIIQTPEYSHLYPGTKELAEAAINKARGGTK